MEVEISYENIVDFKLKPSIDELKRLLDFDESDLSKKELQRSVRNLRSLLIATLEYPFEEAGKAQELSEEMKKMLNLTLEIRTAHAGLHMFAASDSKLDEVREQINESVTQGEE